MDKDDRNGTTRADPTFPRIAGQTVRPLETKRTGIATMAGKEGGPGHPWHGHFEPKRVPEGVWMRCDGCQATLFRKQVEQNLNVCPECNHHFSVSAVNRIAQLLDADTFEEWYADLRPGDPLGFNDRRPYPERVKAEQERTGLNEAAVVGQGFIKGIRTIFGLTDSAFIMGSMGSVVGEKLTRAIEEATRQKLPLVIVSGSGGGASMGFSAGTSMAGSQPRCWSRCEAVRYFGAVSLGAGALGAGNCMRR